MVKDGVPPPPRVRAVDTSGADGARATPRRVVMVGFGRVGQAFALRLHEAGHGRSGFPWRVIGVVDSRDGVSSERGLELRTLVQRKRRTGRISGPGRREIGAVDLLGQLRPDVVIEVSVSDPITGEPGTRHVLTALAVGAQVVASNKGPFGLHYPQVQAAVHAAGRQVRYGTTVGGIVPILETLVERLPPGEVVELTAVLNGTTQFILGRMAEGADLASAIRDAQAQGLSEPDPSVDLRGEDAALKAAILHNALWSPPLSASDVPREAISEDLAPVVRQAKTVGRRIVLLAKVQPGSACVGLTEVAEDSFWASSGPINSFEIVTRHAGRLRLQGAGAGTEATVAGLLADLAAVEGRTVPAQGTWREQLRPDPCHYLLAGTVWPPAPIRCPGTRRRPGRPFKEGVLRPLTAGAQASSRTLGGAPW